MPNLDLSFQLYALCNSNKNVLVNRLLKAFTFDQFSRSLVGLKAENNWLQCECRY